MMLLDAATADAIIPSRWHAPPGAAGDEVLLGSRSDPSRVEWDKIIDDKLLHRFASYVFDVRDDDDLEWPGRDPLAVACRVAQDLRNAGVAPPTGVVPDGEGGLAFEWRNADLFSSLEVKKDGSVELRQFHGGRLLRRQRFGPA